MRLIIHITTHITTRVTKAPISCGSAATRTGTSMGRTFRRPLTTVRGVPRLRSPVCLFTARQLCTATQATCSNPQLRDAFPTPTPAVRAAAQPLPSTPQICS
ncbi:MAG: hypothetical protein ISQ07_10560 [Pirellulales bacterium]|nr:hypothetical protein [Pirellulales bacterium]